MSTEVTTVVTDSQLIGYLDNLGLTAKLTNQEKNTYLQIAKAFGLNPFKREIYVSKYGDNLSIITGYEVYIKRAERSGQLDGWSATTTGSVADGNLKATVTIYRKDRKHPFIWEALYTECVQTTRDGSVTKFWQKAEFMTKKVAISQAFRLCFSDELGGMPYTADEMPNQEEEQPTVYANEEMTISKKTPEQRLKEATTLTELANVYKSLTKAEKEATMALKDQLKETLTNNTQNND
jgi:phage recombination protein Bet